MTYADRIDAYLAGGHSSISASLLTEAGARDACLRNGLHCALDWHRDTFEFQALPWVFTADELARWRVIF